MKKKPQCPFHSGFALISLEGRNKRFVVCRTYGATGPYCDSDEEAFERWYDVEKKNNDNSSQK